ncbi:hypothetical protein A5730_21590 [Mycobacterium sp. ACS4054]|nr:hypothetical protein A5730_21590 [Mycobacterium sp. ACS4054]
MLMDDPQQRIAELERQLAQQKRITELERQLADARAAAGGDQPVERRQPQPIAYAAPTRKRAGAGWVLPVVAVLGGVIGLCAGVGAAVTAVIPSAALWMSPIVCRSGYEMAYNTSHYSYKPGQSGTTVSFQCVGDGGAYDVNDFAVFALQSLLAGLVLCVAAAVGRAIWRRTHRRTPGGR